MTAIRCGSATRSTSSPIATSRRISSRTTLGTKQLKQLTHHDDFDIMTASAGSDAIVYEQAGYIHLFDTKTGQSQAADRSTSSAISLGTRRNSSASAA